MHTISAEDKIATRKSTERGGKKTNWTMPNTSEPLIDHHFTCVYISEEMDGVRSCTPQTQNMT